MDSSRDMILAIYSAFLALITGVAPAGRTGRIDQPTLQQYLLTAL